MSNNGPNRSRMMGEIRDEVEAVDAEDNDILEFAVKVRDEGVLRLLIDKKHAWEEYRHIYGMENVPYTETKEFRQVIEKYTTLTVGDAAEKPDQRWGLLKYFTSKAEKPEIKNLKLVKWLFNFLQNPPDEDNVVALHISGVPNSGKSNFMFFICELWLQTHPDGRVLTNSKSAGENNRRFVHTKGMDELDEWIEENPNTPFFFAFDEANKYLDDEFNRKEVRKQFYPLATLIRHKGGNYAVVGHDIMDIPSRVRSLTKFVHKPSQKRAEFYRSEEDGEPADRFRTLRNIPPTTVDYTGSGDTTDWEWSEERVRTCIGTKTDGDRCQATVRTEYGEDPEFFCDNHHNQDDPHPDVGDEELVGTPFDPEEDSIDGDEDEDQSNVDSAESNQEEPDQQEKKEQQAGDMDSEDIDLDVGSEGEQDAEDRSMMDETVGGNADNSQSNSEDDAEKVDGDEDEHTSDEKQETEPDVDEKNAESEADNTELSVENVPDFYWKILEDRTGGAYRKETVDSLDTFEKILNKSQWEELQDKLS